MKIYDIESILGRGGLIFGQTANPATTPVIMYFGYENLDSRVTAYDKMRKMYNDQQLTLVFYLDKLIISFVDKQSGDIINVNIQPDINSLRKFLVMMPMDGIFFFMIRDKNQAYPTKFSPIRINGFTLSS